MKKSVLFLAFITSVILNVSAQTSYEIGSSATDFKLQNVDDSWVSMADFKDTKGFVVIFTCNHCPYAIAYEDRIMAIHDKYAPKGYPVIAINPNDPAVQPADSFEKMKKRAKEKGFKYPYLFDEGQKVYPVYGATRTPHVFLLNREGNDLIVRYIGTIDDNYSDESAVTQTYLADAIDALIAGKSPDPQTTKAIGCSIKKK
jgi:peroxiredoxin